MFYTFKCFIIIILLCFGFQMLIKTKHMFVLVFNVLMSYIKNMVDLKTNHIVKTVIIFWIKCSKYIHRAQCQPSRILNPARGPSRAGSWIPRGILTPGFWIWPTLQIWLFDFYNLCFCFMLNFQLLNKFNI